MICGNCQAENRADRRFCLRCGQPLASRCPNCGASNEPDAAFCGDCGTRLTVAAGVAPTASASASLAFSGEAPASRSAPTRVAERRLVSVLFADLVDYTSVAEGLDADDARDLLDRYFRAAREIVERYGGVVEKFIGDAVMAVWGAPTSHEDDPERAVRAGLDLVAMAAALGTGAHREQTLQLRAGVLTGEAAVTIGATGQGMVAGDLVNTASRLQSVAEPGTVLAGEATMRSASSAITFERVGDQSLKGKEAPVPAWRAVTVVALRGGAGRSDLIEPPFVGRDAEFSALKERLHATTRDGRARLVSVTGVAGVGKSRLAWELEKYIDGLVEDVYWHHGRSPAYGEGLAFWALGEMVRRRADIRERDDPATTAAKLEACVAEWAATDDERRWIGPHLRSLLGIEETVPGSREELFAAWRTFFERIADRGTTILVFEDLQWADDGLVDFIESVLEWSRSKPILIVTLARPELAERRPTWGLGQREFTSLYLQPLPPAAMTELVRGMGPGLPADLVDRIVERSEGIPLYAVELFRMLLDRGDVASTADGYRVVSATAEVTAPQTLQALIAARLDALPVDERRLLQDASVLGKTFTLQSLAAIMGDDIARLEPLLRSLVRREFLSVDADPRSPERGQYGFVGALVRETAHGTLAKRDRRERHLAAARYFETLGDDELAGVLASHYTDAYAASSPGPEADAVATQARIALRAAAGRSLALASPAQAATYLRRALDVSSDRAEVAALYEEIAGAELLAGAWGRSHAAAAEAVERYEALGDVVGRGRAASTLGECLLVESDIQAAADLLESALAGLPATGAEAVGVGLRARLARAELFRGRPEAAIAAVDAALVVAARLDLIEATADLIVSRAWAVSMMGRHREAAVLQQGVIAFAQEEGLNRVRFRAINNLAADQGDHRPRQTLPLVREAMAEAERVGDRDWADKFAFVAIPAVWMGDWDYAEAVIESRWRDDLPTLLYVAPAIARIVIDALRGNWDAADRVVVEIRRRVADSVSAQDREGLLTSELYVAFARGDIAAVRSAAERWTELARVSFDPLDVALLLGIAASWSNDSAGIRYAISILDDIRTRSELVLALESCLRASLAAHEGRAIAEVVQGYRDGLDGLRAVGHELWALFAGLDAVGLLDPDQPLVAAEVDQIRRFIAQTGATVLSGLLERRLEAARTRDGSAARPAPTRDQAGTAAEQNVLTTS